MAEFPKRKEKTYKRFCICKLLINYIKKYCICQIFIKKHYRINKLTWLRISEKSLSLRVGKRL